MSDVIREVSSESTAFLGDAFALMTREGLLRWGQPAMKRDRNERAKWVVDHGAVVTLARSLKSISVRFDTPQGARADREAEL